MCRKCNSFKSGINPNSIPNAADNDEIVHFFQFISNLTEKLAHRIRAHIINKNNCSGRHKARYIQFFYEIQCIFRQLHSVYLPEMHSVFFCLRIQFSSFGLFEIYSFEQNELLFWSNSTE